MTRLLPLLLLLSACGSATPDPGFVVPDGGLVVGGDCLNTVRLTMMCAYDLGDGGESVAAVCQTDAGVAKFASCPANTHCIPAPGLPECAPN